LFDVRVAAAHCFLLLKLAGETKSALCLHIGKLTD
jgi:hypothetical protein